MSNDLPPVIPGYELIQVIGSGTYGTVWLARGVTGGLRAVKIVRRDWFRSAVPYEREFEGIRRFAEISLREPRQLALLHVGRDDEAGFFYYVMELADPTGISAEVDPAAYRPMTVRELMVPERRPDMAARIRVCSDMARCLASLHSNGLIHRDIKPENVILVRGVPKLADIGLVTLDSGNATVLGTPDYTPKVGGGRASADVYSLGLVIYELIFERERKRFPSLPIEWERNSNWPQLLEINGILSRACSEVVDERYLDGSAILKDLQVIEAGGSIMEPERQRLRLAKARKIVAILALISIFVGIVALWQTAIANNERALRLEVESARKTADDALRRSRISRADAEIAAGRYGRARTLLRDAWTGDPGAAPLEWRMLWTDAQGDPSRELESCGERVNQLEMSPDEKCLAGRTAQGHFVFWNLPTGRIISRLNDGSGVIGYTPFGPGWVLGRDEFRTEFRGPDGSALRFVREHEKLRLESVDRDGSLTYLNTSDLGFFLSHWTPDGLRQINRLTLTLEPRGREIWHAGTTPDGRHALVEIADVQSASGNKSLEVWDWSSACRVASRNLREAAWTVAVSSDSKIAALGLGPSGDCQLVSIPGLNELVRIPASHEGYVSAIAISPDTSRLASGGAEGVVRLSELSEGNALRLLAGHRGRITALHWASNGEALLSADSTGDVRWWRLNEAPRSARRRLSGMACPEGGRIAISTGGEWIAATDSSGDIRLMRRGLDLQDATVLPRAFEPLAFLGADRQLVTRSIDNSLEIWDLQTARRLRSLGAINPVDSNVVEIAVSADHRWVAAQAHSGALAFVSLESGAVRVATNAFGTVALSAFRQGNRFLSGDPEGNLHAWNPETASPDWSYRVTSKVRISDIADLGANGLVAVGDATGRIHLLDSATGTIQLRFQPSDASVHSMAVTPDGSRLAVGSESGTVTLINTTDWREEATYRVNLGAGVSEGHALSRILFSGNGHWLLARTMGGELRAWNTGD